MRAVSVEVVNLTRLAVDPEAVAPDAFDEPYSRVTGAGVIFGASGGVAEAALRMAVEKLTGEKLSDHLEFQPVPGARGVREATVSAGETTVRVAVISGLGNAEPLIQRVVAGEDVGYDLVEIMACPGGCIDGAGNPAPAKVGELRERTEVLFGIDRYSEIRRSRAELGDRPPPAPHLVRPLRGADPATAHDAAELILLRRAARPRAGGDPGDGQPWRPWPGPGRGRASRGV